MLALRKYAAGLLGLALVTAAMAAPLPEPKAVSEDDSKWLLGDAEFFLKLNVKQLMTADLMTKGGTDAMKQAIEKNEQLKAVLAATDLDLTKDVDSILMTGAGLGPKKEEQKALVVIRGKFNQNKIHAALEKHAEKDEKLKLVKEGTTQLYEIAAQDNNLYAAFADKNTLVLTQNKDATVDAVKSGGKKASSVTPSMKAALGKFSGKESVAMALVVNDELKKALGGIPNVGAAAAKVKTLTAGVTLTDAVAVNIAGATGEAASAKQLSKVLDALKATGSAAVAGMEELPPVVGEILEAIKISSSKEAVLIDLKISKEMIEKAGAKK